MRVRAIAKILIAVSAAFELIVAAGCVIDIAVLVIVGIVRDKWSRS